MAPEYDGVAELWWAREGDLEAFGTPEAQAALTEILEEGSHYWRTNDGKEIEFIGRR